MGTRVNGTRDQQVLDRFRGVKSAWRNELCTDKYTSAEQDRSMVDW